MCVYLQFLPTLTHLEHCLELTTGVVDFTQLQHVLASCRDPAVSVDVREVGGECGCGFIIYTPELDRCGGLSLLDESVTMKEAAKRKQRKVQIALCGEWGRRRHRVDRSSPSHTTDLTHSLTPDTGEAAASVV